MVICSAAGPGQRRAVQSVQEAAAAVNSPDIWLRLQHRRPAVCHHQGTSCCSAVRDTVQLHLQCQVLHALHMTTLRLQPDDRHHLFKCRLQPSRPTPGCQHSDMSHCGLRALRFVRTQVWRQHHGADPNVRVDAMTSTVRGRFAHLTLTSTITGAQLTTAQLQTRVFPKQADATKISHPRVGMLVSP